MTSNYHSEDRTKSPCHGKCKWTSVNTLIVFMMITASAIAASPDIAPLLRRLQAVDLEGKNASAAADAWRQLSRIPAKHLPQLLAGMQKASPLAENWLRSAVDTIAERTVLSGDLLPVDDLQTFLLDQTNSPRARRIAYEWIVKVSPNLETILLEQFLDDPSLELRRDAVNHLLEKVDATEGAQPKAKQLLLRAFKASRDDDQIDDVAARLALLKIPVDLPAHYGFVMRWHLIAPFDNTNENGFDVVYPPEQGIDVNASYQGKNGGVRWVIHQTSNSQGTVDLNNAIHNHKGAIAYAYVEFVSNEDQDVQLRLGCINANKIWLNGELLTSHEIYHANMVIDQYVAAGRMQQGKNTILLKIAQNEQTEPWAQNWKFQLRVCDTIGTAILAKNRAAPVPEVTETASLERTLP